MQRDDARKATANDCLDLEIERAERSSLRPPPTAVRRHKISTLYTDAR